MGENLCRIIALTILYELSGTPVSFGTCRSFSIVKRENMWYYCIVGNCKYGEVSVVMDAVCGNTWIIYGCGLQKDSC